MKTNFSNVINFKANCKSVCVVMYNPNHCLTQLSEISAPFLRQSNLYVKYCMFLFINNLKHLGEKHCDSYSDAS